MNIELVFKAKRSDEVIVVYYICTYHILGSMLNTFLAIKNSLVNSIGMRIRFTCCPQNMMSVGFTISSYLISYKFSKYEIGPIFISNISQYDRTILLNFL